MNRTRLTTYATTDKEHRDHRPTIYYAKTINTSNTQKYWW